MCVKGGCLLDVATGSGKSAFAAAETVEAEVDVVGVDLSEEALRKALQRGANRGLSVAFVRGCAECLPFRDEVFDAVFSNFGLAHFSDPREALEEMTRVLRKGGRVGLADYRHPVYVDVHPLFKELEPSAAVGWITDKLRQLHCHSVHTVYVSGDFYVVVGDRSNTQEIEVDRASEDVLQV